MSANQIERELELQQTKEMLARLGKKADNVEKLDKSGREVRLDDASSWIFWDVDVEVADQYCGLYRYFESTTCKNGRELLFGVSALHRPSVHVFTPLGRPP